MKIDAMLTLFSSYNNPSFRLIIGARTTRPPGNASLSATLPVLATYNFSFITRNVGYNSFHFIGCLDFVLRVLTKKYLIISIRFSTHREAIL